MTLDDLLTLQDIDRKLNRLLRESTDIPARIAESASRLEGHRLALAETHEERRQVELLIKEREGEVEVRKQRINKYKTQQMQVKNNDEYRALIREIHSEEKAIRDIEDGELEMMEKLESIRKMAEEREAALAEDETLVSSDTEALESRAAEIAGELDNVQGLRDARAADIDPSWLSRYDRILKHRGDVALVPIENGNICGGCHMQVPPQTVHNAKAATQMTPCDYCGRLVYWPL